MPRIIITVTEEMDTALKRQSDARKAPVAALVREALIEWATKRGIRLESDIVWGSHPVSGKETEPGETVAVAV
jgi:hypothetical protein